MESEAEGVMGYHDLSESTLTADERIAEAERIIGMFEGFEDQLRSNEISMMARVESTSSCSVKQLFWLRDIKERVL
jgi:hypothetical protein